LWLCEFPRCKFKFHKAYEVRTTLRRPICAESRSSFPKKRPVLSFLFLRISVSSPLLCPRLFPSNCCVHGPVVGSPAPGCIFGCPFSQKSTVHYLKCPMLWRRISSCDLYRSALLLLSCLLSLGKISLLPCDWL